MLIERRAEGMMRAVAALLRAVAGCCDLIAYCINVVSSNQPASSTTASAADPEERP
ncbi:hypothetical protein MUU72_06290 [Streptomyces sp. RS10V-4]|uniref:hypothetical protein n=1 Tax=Streptomyces rhizoryzae TaxID=2932493 RepID=UPI0020065E54|nr:hypothetical protein [Streptomyces rhizoryzae]MCK7622714.1 hypothetical protein [Streptomyces rhizoryzae]